MNIDNPDYKHFNLLITSMVGAAENLISKFGEFYPFGGVINVIDKFELTESAVSSEKPEVKEVISDLVSALMTGMKDNRFQAVGICINVSTVNPKTGTLTDAIRVNAQNKTGRRIVYFVPYVKTGNKYQFKGGYFEHGEG